MSEVGREVYKDFKKKGLYFFFFASNVVLYSKMAQKHCAHATLMQKHKGHVNLSVNNKACTFTSICVFDHQNGQLFFFGGFYVLFV